MEETSVKNEFDYNIEVKPEISSMLENKIYISNIKTEENLKPNDCHQRGIFDQEKSKVIVPKCSLPNNYLDISTIKKEEDLKPNDCHQRGILQEGADLVTINTDDNIQRWTVSSSLILPVDKTENTCYVSDQIGITGERSVDRLLLADSVKNEDTDTCGTRTYGLNEHTDQLAVIPNLTLDRTEHSTDNDVPLPPLSGNEQLDHDNSCRNSEIKTSNVSTSSKDDNRLTHSVDHPLYEDKVITPSISSQTSMKQMAEHRNDILESQTLSADLSSNEQFDHSSTGNPEVTTFSGPTSIRSGKGEKPFKCYKCDVCNKEFTRSDVLSAHHRIHTGEKPYTCDICNKTFTHSGNLRAHKLTHNRLREKPLKCDVCCKTFIRPSHLRAHQQTHTGEKPYKCNVCQKTYKRPGHLRVHQHTHTSEKPYKCDVCHKTFKRSSNVRRHKLTHNREKPHKCDVCNKTFTRPSSLHEHKHTHTGEKPFKCGACDKTFTRSSNLSAHQLTHTDEQPHKCDVCNKTFTRSSNLSAHQLTHTGEKPYKCDVCYKTFTKSSSLNAHQRIHTGERPYKCDVCNKAYTRSDGLRVHQRTHTGKNT